MKNPIVLLQSHYKKPNTPMKFPINSLYLSHLTCHLTAMKTPFFAANLRFFSPGLGASARPVLSTVSTRPLRRPSSAAALDKGRLDELLAQAEAVKDEAGERYITGMYKNYTMIIYIYMILVIIVIIVVIITVMVICKF